MHDAKAEFPVTDSSPSRAHHQSLLQSLALATLVAAARPERPEFAATFLREAVFEIMDRAPGRSWIVWWA